MKLWKKVLIGLVGFIVLLGLVLGIGGMMIDPKVELGIEKRLAPSPAKLYPFLSTAGGLDAWWKKGQQTVTGMPKMEVKKKSGPDEGVGLVVTFEADGQVMETWEVKAAEPTGRIVYAVDFAGMLTIERTLTLTPDADGTKVSWREKGTMENPLMRWSKVLMPAEAVTKNFDTALGALEKAATP